eukprot:scaffold154600_cov18-Prasinocladus_malaysianus.AAC.1
MSLAFDHSTMGAEVEPDWGFDHVPANPLLPPPCSATTIQNSTVPPAEFAPQMQVDEHQGNTSTDEDSISDKDENAFDAKNRNSYSKYFWSEDYMIFLSGLSASACDQASKTDARSKKLEEHLKTSGLLLDAAGLLPVRGPPEVRVPTLEQSLQFLKSKNNRALSDRFREIRAIISNRVKPAFKDTKLLEMSNHPVTPRSGKNWQEVIDAAELILFKSQWVENARKSRDSKIKRAKKADKQDVVHEVEAKGIPSPPEDLDSNWKRSLFYSALQIFVYSGPPTLGDNMYEALHKVCPSLTYDMLKRKERPAEDPRNRAEQRQKNAAAAGDITLDTREKEVGSMADAVSSAVSLLAKLIEKETASQPVAAQAALPAT